MGDLDSAISTMTKARRYETPWNDENCKTVSVFLNSLITEKALIDCNASPTTEDL
jgi:hypothetical protein